jgi:hypothetical protein
MNLRSRMRAWSGGVAERLIAPVLKTGRPKGLVSSNLTPSASLVERVFDVVRAEVSRISFEAGDGGGRSRSNNHILNAESI